MEQTTNEAIVQKNGGARLQKEAPETQRRRKKGPLIIGIIILAVMLAADLGLGWYANSTPKFWPNTHIIGQDVSGLTAEEATVKLEAALPDIGLFIYDMQEEDRFFDASMASDLSDAPPHVIIPLSELGVKIDPAAVTRAAYKTQHSGSLLSAGKEYLSMHRGRRFINYTGASTYELDEKAMAEAAEKAAQALSYPAQDTSYTVEDGAIRLTAAMDGRQVDTHALLDEIKNLSWHYDLSLKVSCSAVPAKTRTAREIYDEVSSEVRNAGYDAATQSIIPEQVGADFDVAAAQAALDAAQPGETVEVPATIEYPSVTAEELKAVLFRDVLGEARTKVGGTAARKSNVSLSAASINGYVMNTGDIFSYNDTVGQRTAARGYKPAPAYVKGETVDEIGGGICQTSSTLYLACLRSNLEITERYAHRYIPAYISAGMDATVSWGGPDYKFTNNTDYPIKIETEYSGGYVTVRVLGTNVTGITAKMTNERLSTTNFEVVYEDDPTLAPGQETVKTTPYTGSKWRTYRHLYDKDGKLISSTYEATSDYKVRNKVIVKGPAKAAEPSTPVIGPGEIPVTPEEPAVLPAEPPVEETPGTPIVVLPDDFLGGAA